MYHYPILLLYRTNRLYRILDRNSNPKPPIPSLIILILILIVSLPPLLQPDQQSQPQSQFNTIPPTRTCTTRRTRRRNRRILQPLQTQTPMAPRHDQVIPQTPIQAGAEIPPSRGLEICETQMGKGYQVDAVGEYWM